MTRTSNKITRSLAPALVLAAVVAPNAAAQHQDLRSPDARDAAAVSAATQSQDLRSPDARDAALAADARNYQDLRSPDARDVGRVVSSPSPLSTPSNKPSDTAWDEVGIVAGVLSLVLIGLGGAFLRRRSAIRRLRATVASS